MAAGCSRRRWVAGLAAAPLAGCAPAPLQRWAGWAEARKAIQALRAGGASATGAWSLAQVLEHAAQSIEYSISGFPEMKPGAFRATIGRAAWALFDARGRMSHPLDQPIPGAPVLQAGRPLSAAIDRLLAAMDRFDAHTGALKPHFAYGELDKPAYARAHLMHLADHWQELHSA